MAKQKIDVSGYQNWEKINMPNGQVLYAVPGSGYAYDPFASKHAGHSVFYENPKPKLDAIKQQQQAASPTGQLLAQGGVLAGTLGGAWALDKWGPTAPVGAPTLLPNGNLATQLTDGTIKITNTTTGAVVPQSAGQATSAQQSFVNSAVADLPTGAIGQAVTESGAPGYMMADGSIVPQSQGLFGMGNLATGALGAAGLGAGLYGAYQANQNENPLMGAVSGAGAGAGASALGTALGLSAIPGIGWLAGGGALLGLGAGLLGKIGDKDRWKTEANRANKLAEQGIYVPPELLGSLNAQTKGRSRRELTRADLPDDFIGRDSQGNWVNNKFALSRDEKDLRGEDIVNYSSFAEKDPEWFKKPLEERIGYAQKLLDAGVVREHHSTIDVDWKKAEKAGALGLGQAAPAVATTAALAGPNKTALTPQEAQRSRTASPGIGLDGKRLSPKEMGKILARRSDARM